MQSKKKWFLRKKDGSEYGPVSLNDLQRWSDQCRLVAGNAVSEDREEWTPVEDIQELEMHWMAQRADGKEYGPFALTAAQELYSHSVLPAEAILVNRLTGENRPLADVIDLPDSEDDEAADAPRDKKPEKGKKESSSATQEAEESAEKAEEPAEVDESEATSEESTETDESVESADDGPEESDGSDRSVGSDEAAVQAEAGATADQGDAPPPESEEDEAIMQTETAVDKTSHSDENETDSDDAPAGEDLTAPLLAQIDALQQELEDVRSTATDADKNYQKKLASLEKKLQSTQTEAQESATRLEALKGERQQVKQQVGEELADLRKQTAFMKKNIAVLHSELDDSRNQATRRGRIVLVLGTILTLIAALLIIRTVGGCERKAYEETPAQPQTGNGIAGPDNTTSSDDDNGVTTTAQWPSIQVDGLRVERKSDHLVIAFDEGAFASMTTLSDAASEQLKTLVEQLGTDLQSYRLVVEGHTDSTPMRATSLFADNAALAAARAETGAAYLQREGAHAIAATTPGQAPYPNDTPSNRKRNRTLVIKLYR